MSMRKFFSGHSLIVACQKIGRDLNNIYSVLFEKISPNKMIPLPLAEHVGVIF